MARHKDVVFEAGGAEHRTLKDAVVASMAVATQAGHVQVHVIAKSKAGARWYGGQSCVELFTARQEMQLPMPGHKKSDGEVIDRYEIRRLGPT